MSFEERLAQSRDGNADALDGLFAQWRPLLRLQARKSLGAELSARVDPSDVVQEAITQAYATLDQFRGHNEGEWVAWLRKMVMGHAAKTRRHHLAGKRNADKDMALPDLGLADSSFGPLKKAISREHALALAIALERLPDSMREVVLRRVFHQEPFEVIAQDLGRTPGATRVIWTRAIRQLRDMLAGSSDRLEIQR